MEYTVISIELSADARGAAYRTGMCIDCGLAPHSPGRPRCEQCHHAWVHDIPPGALDFDDIYSRELCAGPVCRRGGKTGQFRVRHDSGLCEFCTTYESQMDKD